MMISAAWRCERPSINRQTRTNNVSRAITDATATTTATAAGRAGAGAIALAVVVAVVVGAGMPRQLSELLIGECFQDDKHRGLEYEQGPYSLRGAPDIYSPITAFDRNCCGIG